MADTEVLKAISALDLKVSTYIAGQDVRCKDCEGDLGDLEHTIYGNGNEGLKTSHTKLATRVNIIIAILAPIALALAVALIAALKIGVVK